MKQSRARSRTLRAQAASKDAAHVPASNHAFWRPATAIFSVALIVRLVHVWHIRAAPFFGVLMGDSRAYDQWAQRIAAGDWLGAEVFYQSPLYPYFLGSLYAIAGRDLLVVRVCQAILGALACIAIAYAGRRLFSARVGLMAGIMLALYAPAIFFDGLIQKSTLDVFFVCMMLALVGRIAVEPAIRWPWLWLGIVVGGLSLTRENALVFAGIILLWAFNETVADRKSRPYMLFAVGLAIVLVPVASRNYAVGGGFHLTTSQFGPNFYIGNNPRSDGTYMSLRAGRGAPEYERQDAIDLAERAVGRRLTPAEVSTYWTGRAFEYIRSEPEGWLKLLARKGALVWNAAEMVDTESQSTHEEWSPLLRSAARVGHFGVLVPLAVFGIFATWARRRRLWVLHAMLAAYTISVVMFYVFARYRFPLVPFLVLFAAAGIDAAIRWLLMQLTLRPTSDDVGRNVSSGTFGLAAAAVAAVFCNWPLLSADRMRAISETNLGVALHEERRLAEAAASYRRALAISPDYAPAHNNFGATLRGQGRLDDAIGQFEEALRLYPGYPSASRNLVNALHERGNTRADRGALDDALADLRRVVSLEENDAGARYDLASTLMERGRHREAVDEFRAALRLKRTPETHNNLGIALGSLGRLDEAIVEFRSALALKPGFADAERNLAMLEGRKRGIR